MSDEIRDPFIIVIQYIKDNLGCGAYSQDADDVYHIEGFSDQLYHNVCKSRKNGSNLIECCKMLEDIFSFNPAFLSGVSNGEFVITDSIVGLYGNIISWINLKELWNSEYLSVLLCTMIYILIEYTDPNTIYFLKEIYIIMEEEDIRPFVPSIVHLLCKLISSKHESIEYTLPLLHAILSASLAGHKKDLYDETLFVLQDVIPFIKTNTINFDHIVTITGTMAIDFDSNTLETIGLISDFHDCEQAKNLFSIMARATIDYIDEHKSNELSKLDSEDRFIDLSQKITRDNFFNITNDIKASDLSGYRTTKKIEEFLNEDILYILGVIRGYLHRKRYSELYFEGLKNNFTEHQNIDLILFIIGVLSTSNIKTINTELIQKIAGTQIFSDEYINDTFAFNIRSILVRTLLEFYPGLISQILIEKERSPIMFADIINTIQVYYAKEDLEAFVNRQVSDSFSNVLQVCVLHFSQFSQQWNDIMHFVTTNFGSSRTANSLLSSFSFATIFLDHIYSPSVYDAIFALTRRFLISQNPSTRAIDHVLQFVMTELSDRTEKTTNKLVKLIDLIADVITQKPSLGKSTTQILPSVIKFVAPNKIESEGEKEGKIDASVIHSLLQFLIALSSSDAWISLSTEQIARIAKAIRRAEPKGCSEETFNSIMAIISKNRTLTDSNSTVIERPQFLMLLAFVSYLQLSRFCSLIYSMCKASILNRASCHDGGVDLFLIEMLRNYPNGFRYSSFDFPQNVDENTVEESIFPALTLMFETMCSLPVAERFIGLAIPSKRDNEYIFPKFASRSISMVNLIMKTIAASPIPKITYNHDDCRATSLTTLKEGFTFFSRIMVDLSASQTYLKPRLLTLQDNSYYFNVYLTGQTVFCEIKTPMSESSASVFCVTKSCEWISFSMTVTPRDNSSRLVVISDNDQGDLFNIPSLEFGKGTNAYVGGFVEECKIKKPFFFIADFELYKSPLTVDEIRLIGRGGYKVDRVKTAKFKINENESFFHPLTTVAKTQPLFDGIVPFFNFASYASPIFIEQLVDLLSCIPSSVYFDGYEAIAHSIQNFKDELLTFSLYRRLFEAVVSTSSEVLFKDVVFSFGLWSRSSAISKVSGHWASTIPSVAPQMLSKIPLRDVITWIRRYFWFTPVEKENIEHKRFDHMDINVVRYHLNMLMAAMVSADGIDEDNVDYLITTIFSLRDYDQTVYFLVLLEVIAQLIPPNQRLKVAAQLHQLFACPNPDVFVAAMRAVFALAGDKACFHVENMTCHASGLKLSTDIFEAVMGICTEIPEATGIAAMIAAQTEEKNIDEFSTKFVSITSDPEKASKVGSVKTWFVWPTIASLKHPGDSQYLVMVGIFHVLHVLKSMNVIDEILCFLDILEVHNKADVHKMRGQLLENIIDNILTSDLNQPSKKGDPDADGNGILLRCARYVFFRFQPNTHTPKLLKEIEEFGVDYTSNPPLEYIPPKSFSDIVDALTCAGNARLVFRIHDGDTRLTSRMAAITRDLSSSDETSKRVAQIFNYLSEKSELNEKERFEEMKHISAFIPHYASVMDITYSKFMKETGDKLSKHIKKVAADFGGGMKSDSLQTFMKSVEYIGEQKQNDLKRENELKAAKSLFEYHHLHPHSLLGEFAPKRVGETSQRICDFQTPLISHHVDVYLVERKLKIEERPKVHMNAVLISLAGMIEITFVITKTQIIFKTAKKTISHQHSDLEAVLHRVRSTLSCLEFVFKDGHSYFVDFFPRSLADVLPLLRPLKKNVSGLYQQITFYQFIYETGITRDWAKGRLSNLEYICALNFYGGRSFRSLGSYPVLPNVNAELSLNTNSYRRPGHSVFIPLLKYFEPIFEKRKDRSSYPITNQSYAFYEDQSRWKDTEAPSPRGPTVSEEELTQHYTMRPISKPANSVVELLESNEFELIPEFFSSPECFEGIVENPSQFVYELRVKLESPEFTTMLPDWIDRTFGVRQPDSSGIIQLFKVNHPYPKKRPIPPSLPVVLEISEATILSSTVFATSTSTIRVIATTEDSSQTITIDVDLLGNTFETRSHQAPEGICAPLHDTLAFFKPEGGVEVINGLSHSVKMDSPPPKFVSKWSREPSGCTEDGQAFVFTKYHTLVESNASPEMPTCVSSSDRFHTTAVGTESGRILFFTGGRMRASAECGFVPENICIAEGAGIVIASSGTEIRSFTVNGLPIASMTSCGDISIVRPITDAHGFDFVIVSDTRGRIQVASAWDLKAEGVFDCRSQVSSLCISSSAGGLCAVTQSGSFIFIPYRK